MNDKEFFDWLKTCPTEDWSVIDATTSEVKIKFPVKMFKEMDKSLLRVHNSTSSELWITDSEIREATEQAVDIFDEFFLNTSHGEETWTEIQIGDKFFDLNCWDEGMGDGYEDRKGAVHCTIYPTKELENGYRYNEGDIYLRLFTVDESMGED